VRSKFVSSFAVLGAVAVLVLAANTVALATTGKALLAGKINTSSKVTTLVRTTPGTGLQVKTKSSTNPPFAVNGRGKVVNLNVDKVDGLDGGTRAFTWSYTGTVPATRTFTLGGLPSGNYLISWDLYIRANQVPAGTLADCYLSAGGPTGDRRYSGEAAGTHTTSFGIPLSSTGLVVNNPNGDVVLECRTTGAASWTAFTDQPVRITAVPLAGVTNKGTPLDIANRSAARSAK